MFTLFRDASSILFTGNFQFEIVFLLLQCLLCTLYIPTIMHQYNYYAINNNNIHST